MLRMKKDRLPRQRRGLRARKDKPGKRAPACVGGVCALPTRTVKLDSHTELDSAWLQDLNNIIAALKPVPVAKRILLTKLAMRALRQATL